MKRSVYIYFLWSISLFGAQSLLKPLLYPEVEPLKEGAGVNSPQLYPKLESEKRAQEPIVAKKNFSKEAIIAGWRDVFQGQASIKQMLELAHNSSISLANVSLNGFSYPVLYLVIRRLGMISLRGPDQEKMHSDIEQLLGTLIKRKIDVMGVARIGSKPIDEKPTPLHLLVNYIHDNQLYPILTNFPDSDFLVRLAVKLVNVDAHILHITNDRGETPLHYAQRLGIENQKMLGLLDDEWQRITTPAALLTKAKGPITFSVFKEGLYPDRIPAYYPVLWLVNNTMERLNENKLKANEKGLSDKDNEVWEAIYDVLIEKKAPVADFVKFYPTGEVYDVVTSPLHQLVDYYASSKYDKKTIMQLAKKLIAADKKVLSVENVAKKTPFEFAMLIGIEDPEFLSLLEGGDLELSLQGEVTIKNAFENIYSQMQYLGAFL